MSITPLLRCRNMRLTLDFYTGVLDFTLMEANPATAADPAIAWLRREGADLMLSSHAGDGQVGQPVMVRVADIDAVFDALLGRGLDRSGHPDSPVHQAPVDQTWGTREFYVADPSGNTVRFWQR